MPDQDPVASFLSTPAPDPIASFLSTPPPRKLNAAGLPEASAAVEQATNNARQFVQQATQIPAVDPLSGMAIPGAGAPPAVDMKPAMTVGDRLKRLALGTAQNPTQIRLAAQIDRDPDNPSQPARQGPGAAASAPLLDVSSLFENQEMPQTAVGKTLAGGAQGLTDVAQGLTSPASVATIAGTMGTGVLPKTASVIAAKLVSAGFSADMLHSAYQSIPAFRESADAGDIQGAARIAASMAGSLAMAGMAGHHAVEGVPGAVDGAIDAHNAEASRLTRQDAGEAQPFLPRAEGKLSDDALDTLQRVEPDASKRAALATEAKKRNLAVPDRSDPVAQFLNTKPTDEDAYRDLFDEADKRTATAQKRAAQQTPEVPEEGVPENVSRVVDARERLAQSLLGKPFGEAVNSERNTIDDLVKQGYGTAVQPGEGGAAEEAKASELPVDADESQKARKPESKIAYGKPTTIRVPGEDTAYPARYAVRESDDVQTSHDPVTFQPNPDYAHANERDYSNPENAARTVEYSLPGKFNPDYTLTESPTAEHGPTIVDADANALGGNNRAMTVARAYEHPELGPMYRSALEAKAKQFGVDPAELSKFDKPTLTRELTDPKVDPQTAIADFNKGAPAALMPEERAVADGKRLSPKTLQSVSGMIEDHGANGGSLADALRGDNGAEVAQHLVDDGVITDQEKNGMVDQSGNLTPDAKSRVAKALTGRLFDTPKDYAAASPELRAKLDRIAPHVFRAEGRPEWAIGDRVKDAVSVLNEAKARGIAVDDLAKQPDLNGKTRDISPDALAVAKKLQESPNKAAQAFRQYAGDERLSRPGAQEPFFEPPSRQEAFDAAFGEDTASRNGTHAEEMPAPSSGTSASPRDPSKPFGTKDRIVNSRDIAARIAHLEAEDRAGRSPEAGELENLRYAEKQNARNPEWKNGVDLIHEDRFDAHGERLARKAFEDHKIPKWLSSAVDLDQAIYNLKDGHYRETVLGSDDDSRTYYAPKRGNGADAGKLDDAEPGGVHAEEMPGAEKQSAGEHGMFPPVPPRRTTAGAGPTAPRPAGAPRVRPAKLNPFAQRVVDVARGVANQARSIQKVFAPQTLDVSGEQAGLILRGRLAEAARSYDQAEHSLREAKKMFDRMPAQANHDFIDNVEHGRPQATPELDQIGTVMRGILDPRRDAVQALGKGKLRNFFADYFPHVWKKFDSAKQTIGQMLGRRPLEGSKGFLKQRTHVTFADGIAAGLEPVSKNPVDLVLLKAREMDRYLLAHRALNDFKDQGIARYVDARVGKAPPGWTKISDPIGAVYGDSKLAISEYQNEGLYRGLEDFASSIGVNHDRSMKLQNPNALGLSHTGQSQIDTKFATDPQTLAHEIGHQLEDKYNLSDALMKHPDAKTRVSINRELRALADLRFEGTNPSQHFKDYVRNKDEKMAAVVQAYVSAPERMEQVAPTVKREFEAFLNRNPKLAALTEVKPNLKHLELQDHLDAGGLVTKGNYYAPDSVATLMNNHLAPGLRGSEAYRAGVGLNNSMNMFQLGLSGFHAAKVSVESMIQRGGLGIEQMLRGRPLTGLGTFASAPAAPFRNMIAGDKMLKEWYKPGASGGLIGAYVDELQKAGGRARMDDFYQSRVGDRMMRMFREGGVGNTLGGIARVPAAAVEFLPKIIMSEVVPRLKMGAFADAAKYDLERLGPSNPDGVRKSLSQTWDSIEDRMGQMTQDNLFWHRTAHDIAGLMTRSVSWNLGTLRGVGGSLIDAVKAPYDVMRGNKTYDQVNLRRVGNTASMVALTMTWGALRTYMNTGQGPQSLKDYFFPKKADGTRESPLSYVTDAYEFAKAPLHAAANKASPLVNLASAIARNKDYKGDKLWDDSESPLEKLGDAAKYTAGQFLPMSVHQAVGEGSLKDRMKPALGIRNAPRDIDQTDAERTASEISQARMAEQGRSKEQAATRAAEREIAGLARAGKSTSPAIASALQAGTLSGRQIRETLANARMKPLAGQVHRMGLEDALRVWDRASEEERKTLRPVLARKSAALRDMPAAERAALMPRLQKALGTQ